MNFIPDAETLRAQLNTCFGILPRHFGLNYWTWRTQNRLKDLRTAWRFFAGTLTKDDAENLIVHCEPIAGWHPLVSITVDDVMVDVSETYADHPELHQLVASACARVGRKWDDNGETLSSARDWALEIIEEDARNEGITLVRLDGEDTEVDANDA